jgi:hypothetical protein
MYIDQMGMVSYFGYYLINPLQVLGRTEAPQVDECVCHQLHGVVSTLQVLKPQQQSLKLILPGKRPLHSVP